MGEVYEYFEPEPPPVIGKTGVCQKGRDLVRVMSRLVV